MVHTSSVVTVGANPSPSALDERAPWNLERLGVPYVTTKRQAEAIALGAAGKDLEVVVVNPGCTVGPDDFARSEYGTLCRRFWLGRIPFYFGGGNCFVDVRDVAVGHLLAAQRGKSGQRYILGGENMSYQQFFRMLSAIAGRRIFRLRLPLLFGPLAGWLNDRLTRGGGKRPYLTPFQARLLGLYFYFSSARANHELGYRSRPMSLTLADTYKFWFGSTKARKIAPAVSEQ
jgi:dihydroflavonol-4-reductase